MKTKILASMAVFGLLAVAVACYAGPLGLFSPRPAPVPVSAWRVGPQAVSLTVVIDPSIDTPLLSVPRSMLVTTERKTGALGITSPVMTGLALSSSLVVGGFWLAGRARRRVVLASALALFAVGTGVLLADIPSPDGKREWTPRPPFPPINVPPLAPLTRVELPASISLPKNIRMTIVETGDSLQLSLPSAKPAPDARPDEKVPEPPIAISKPRPVTPDK